VQTHTLRAAWLQGIVLLVACAAIAGTLAWRIQRPFHRDTLAIQVGRLQSHAAEAQLLADNVRRDNLAPSFVRQHAMQLADKVDDVDGKLDKPAQPALAAIKSSARQLGASLHDTLQALGRDAHLPRNRTLGFDALAQRLDALHTQLKPKDAGS
jgi:hypothetical protein